MLGRIINASIITTPLYISNNQSIRSLIVFDVHLQQIIYIYSNDGGAMQISDS